MGFKVITLKLPTGYGNDDLNKAVRRKTGLKNFEITIEKKALDARNKRDIHFLLRVSVKSPELKTGKPEQYPKLEIPYSKRKEKAVVVGSGPAGFFAALVLQKAGIDTIILERGSDVDSRKKRIENFENSGVFDTLGNYAFGEGGAGTFSDGKLTSRSKRISKEKRFILQTYVEAGAPEEILYLTHPHLGSDNLRKIVKKLRKQFENLGGKVFFETEAKDINVKNGKVLSVNTTQGIIEAEYFLFAIGHSAFDTFRMLIKNGVIFNTKNFAIGSRMEHRQELINKAQWGVAKLPGVKAAEYRLTSQVDKNHPVYTFCMCPGGKIVPATAFENRNIVNGMSMYARDGKFANAACVAGLNLNKLLNRDVSASETLEWLDNLERKFYENAGGYKAPFCTITDFIGKKISASLPETSYPMGLIQAPLWEWLPQEIANAMRKGLIDFSKKIKGFETGNILGLESKTSAAIQVERDKNGKCSAFDNLYVIGEGSGFSGGIISSAADGVKAALNIIYSQ